VEMAVPTESVCWRAFACSESCASCHASAASHSFLEDIGIHTIIESELKLREAQGKIFSAYVVIGADCSALQFKRRVPVRRPATAAPYCVPRIIEGTEGAKRASDARSIAD
jgi:hypothetical protein